MTEPNIAKLIRTFQKAYPAWTVGTLTQHLRWKTKRPYTRDGVRKLLLTTKTTRK